MSSLDFIEKVMTIGGNGNEVPTLEFWKKGFKLGGGKVEPVWRDIILKGRTALSLVNAKADSLEYLKLFGGTELLPETYLDTVTLSGGCEQRNLPSGYTQVEYLEVATEGAYFSTGINATVDTDMGITASNITSNSAQLLVAQCESGSDYFRIAKAGASQRVIGSLGSSTVTDNNSDGINKFTARINKSGLYVNGSLIGTFSNVPSSLTDVGEIDIFRGKYGNSIYFAYIGSRFYSTWVDDNIFYPCRRNSDNQLGIYNTKTGQFILPLGEGTFIAGPDVTAPSPDNPMDIVCNNGAIKVSKNLFTGQGDITQNYYLNDNGVEVPATTLAYTNGYTEVNSGTYTFSGFDYASTQESNFSAVCYDVNKNVLGKIGRMAFSSNYSTFTTLPNTKYLRFNIPINTTSTSPLQLEQGSTVTPYMPYGQIYVDGTVETVTDSNQLTASAERLLAVGNYKDTQEVLNGSITRRIGIKVLDGTEVWTKGGTYNQFYSANVITDRNYSLGSIGYCTHYTMGSDATDLGEYGCMRFGTISQQINFSSVGLSATTVEEWKQWLAEQYANGTPVIIVYPLETATTESATSQLLTKSPVTQTAGSIDNLPIAITASSHTTPIPQQPLDINCNNGVVKIRNKSGLPLGYQKVEKLTFTSGAYIVTDIHPNQDTEFIVDIQKGTDDLAWLFGTRNYASTSSPSENKYSLQAFSPKSNTIWCQFDNTTSTEYNSIAVTSDSAGRTARHTIGIKNKQIWMDGSAVEWGSYGTPDWSNFTALNPLIIGGNYVQASGVTGTFSGDLCGATGLILCKRLSDNVAGVYNPTTGNFSPADGTGTITAGNPVDDLEIYVDGTTETVEITGKNLWSNDITFTSGSLNANTGQPTASSISHYTSAIPVKIGETYTFSLLDGVESGTFQAYKRIIGYSSANITDFVEQLAFIDMTGKQGQKGFATITIPASVNYIRVSCGLIDSEYQLEYGSTATSYEPYYYGGSATAEDLFKVGNYQDVQSVIDGEVTRNVGIKVVDGTEDWKVMTNDRGYYLKLNDLLLANYEIVIGFCTHFKFNFWDDNAIPLPTNNFGFNHNGTTRLTNTNVTIKPDLTVYDTVDKFKAWLASQYNAGSPVVILYPLATPTTETVTAQPMNIQAGTNIVQITQASMDDLELEVKYKAGVSVTITEIENAQLDDNVEVTING